MIVGNEVESGGGGHKEFERQNVFRFGLGTSKSGGRAGKKCGKQLIDENIYCF